MIPRDIANTLAQEKGTYIQILIGPRQCGKSTLFAYLSEGRFNEVSLDDFQMRQLANSDPGLFLSQHPIPLIVDEVQYAPDLFPEFKRLVDDAKRKRLFGKTEKAIHIILRLTGSNQILLDKQVKESLVGRASYYDMNTLSVHEILAAYPDMSLYQIIFRGGWPELYTNTQLRTVHYLNDYMRNYIEKDIVLSAGIAKQNEFHTVLGMLAARTGGFLNYSDIAKDSGVRSVTVKEWISILERSHLLYLLSPCESNLNKRLIKMPKLYFLDTGLAVRLQGWTELEPLTKSPQIGALFETLVLAEIVKTIQNFALNWRVSVWRTKEEKIDFIIETGKGIVLALDAKLGIHGVKPCHLPNAFKKAFPKVKELIVVSLGGKKTKLAQDCLQLPLAELCDYLLNIAHTA